MINITRIVYLQPFLKTQRIGISMLNFDTMIPFSRFLFMFLAVCILTFPVGAQDNNTSDSALTVNGLVLAPNGDPIPNVTISVEGSKELPSVSNEQGEFQLNPPSDSEWIIFAPTSGFKRKRIFLNKQAELKVYLTPVDILSGDETVSILSQSIRKKDMVTSHSTVKVDDQHKTGVNTIDQLMQGKIPGLNVINRSGMPYSGAFLSLRGINSLYANNQPLILIDGTPITPHDLYGSHIDGYSYNPLSTLNLFDVSKATVIKDPTILAAYGSKASNGMLVIETLDPSITQTTIEIDYRTGYSLAQEKLIPQLDGTQHRTLMNEVLFSSGLIEEDIKENYPSLYLDEDEDRYIDYLHDTKWQDYIFRNAVQNDINIKVKGGDEIARYGFSFGIFNKKGIIKETDFQGYNLRFVSRLNIFRWLKMDAGVGLTNTSSNLKEAGTVQETSPILTSLAKSPLMNPYKYDLEGEELEIIANVDEIGVSNPVATIENFSADNVTYDFVASVNLEAKLNNDFAIRSDMSYTYDFYKEQMFLPNLGMELYYNDEAHNVAENGTNTFNSFYNNTYLKYNKAFGINHTLSISTGLQVRTNQFEYDWGLTKNAHTNDEYRSLQDGQENLREIGGATRVWNWAAYYGYLNYAFQDKYLLSASVSLDGSSRIGKEALNTIKTELVPIGLFYSGGIAWRVSSEPFLKNVSWLEEFKLRGSYGITGNDDIGESAATRYYRAKRFRQAVGIYPATTPNDKLTYETVTQMNGGLDLSLLGSRFNASFDYFISNTDNMLVFRPIDQAYGYVGYDYRLENGGTMQNVGWETNVFYRIIAASSFSWDIQATISSITNEITSIKGDLLSDNVLGGQIVNVVGSPANSFYGYEYLGVFSTTEEANAAALVNDRDIAYEAGDAHFADISGPNGTPDNVIDEYDKKSIGSPLPEYFGGLSNTFSYKRWSLSAFVQFVSGNEVFNYMRYKNEQMSTLANQSTNVLNRWQYEGQQTDVPRAYANDPAGNSAFSTRWIEDGSYIRVKNITLSYKIPSQFIVFKNAEFYFTAHNMFVFSNYLGYDPEFAYSFNNIHQGIDYGQTPQVRQFLAGVKLGL